MHMASHSFVCDVALELFQMRMESYGFGHRLLSDECGQQKQRIYLTDYPELVSHYR